VDCRDRFLPGGRRSLAGRRSGAKRQQNLKPRFLLTGYPSWEGACSRRGRYIRHTFWAPNSESRASSLPQVARRPKDEGYPPAFGQNQKPSRTSSLLQACVVPAICF
jgi:hypothetical protein